MAESGQKWPKLKRVSKNDTGFHEKLLPVDELLSLKSSDNKRSDNCYLHDGISPILRPSKSMPLYDQGKNSETKVVCSLKTVESNSKNQEQKEAQIIWSIWEHYAYEEKEIWIFVI